jgi:hypothetical protein
MELNPFYSSEESDTDGMEQGEEGAHTSGSKRQAEATAEDRRDRESKSTRPIPTPPHRTDNVTYTGNNKIKRASATTSSAEATTKGQKILRKEVRNARMTTTFPHHTDKETRSRPRLQGWPLATVNHLGTRAPRPSPREHFLDNGAAKVPQTQMGMRISNHNQPENHRGYGDEGRETTSSHRRH